MTACDCGHDADVHDRAGCCNPTCPCRRPGPGGATEWLLTLDMCGPVFVTNASEKMHWKARQTKRAEWRDAATVLARAWRIPKGLSSILVTCWPRLPNMRAMPDPDAPSPSLKGVLDGLVVAGIIQDDRAPFVEEVRYRPARVERGLPPALLVQIRALEVVS